MKKEYVKPMESVTVTQFNRHILTAPSDKRTVKSLGNNDYFEFVDDGLDEDDLDM